MDGLLVIDKPVGPSSHDAVVRVRRALGERRIGHTGTLDPIASGVLPLVLGRATRLARFLSAEDKSYEAVIRLGVSTDTHDSEGRPVGPVRAGVPSRAEIERALDAFRGTILQQPPLYSAKKIAGRRSYRIARAARARADAREMTAADCSQEPSVPSPVKVTAHALDVIDVVGDRVTLRVTCSAGFYVRALARDLGEQLGVGGHLLALRRTRSGTSSIDRALALEAVEGDPSNALRTVVPVSGMLPDLRAVMLTSAGVSRARHGRDLSAADLDEACAGFLQPAERTIDGGFVRLVAPDGGLVAIGTLVGASGVLHPSVVLV